MWEGQQGLLVSCEMDKDALPASSTPRGPTWVATEYLLLVDSYSANVKYGFPLEVCRQSSRPLAYDTGNGVIAQTSDESNASKIRVGTSTGLMSVEKARAHANSLLWGSTEC